VPTRSFVIRFIYILTLALTIAVVVGLVFILQSKEKVFHNAEPISTPEDSTEPFPVSIDIEAKKIIENPVVDSFYMDTLANRPESTDRWWNQVAAVFSSYSWYQNLASPVSRIIVIWPGERKEESVNNIAKILNWDQADKDNFKQQVDSSEPVMRDGKYYPGQYVIHKDATPAEVHELIRKAFETQILERYTEEVEEIVPLEDALIIASLLEREASDFENMREVSGVIWNRLFIDMPLQLDATLQYVRGSKSYEPAWWPIPRPKDKYLDSPFNTYLNEGLPPAPIANPSSEAVLAALNPVATDCLYYFHTSDGGYHCSPSYEEHVSKLRSIYGRGS